MKKLFLTILLLLFSPNSFAGETYFLDFDKILNSSKAGSAAQGNLKLQFKNQTKKFKDLESSLRNEENEIISQNKLLSADEYKKKVTSLREKVADLRKKKQDSLIKIAKSRNKAKADLLKALNPIIQKYMEDNKIRLVIDKKSVLLGDVNLDITEQIITVLNKEVSSIKVN